MSIIHKFPKLKEIYYQDLGAIFDHGQIEVIDHYPGEFKEKQWPYVLFKTRYPVAVALAKRLEEHDAPSWLTYSMAQASKSIDLNYDWYVQPEFSDEYDLIYRLSIHYDTDYQLFFWQKAKWLERLQQDFKSLKSLFSEILIDGEEGAHERSSS